MAPLQLLIGSIARLDSDCRLVQLMARLQLLIGSTNGSTPTADWFNWWLDSNCWLVEWLDSNCWMARLQVLIGWMAQPQRLDSNCWLVEWLDSNCWLVEWLESNWLMIGWMARLQLLIGWKARLQLLIGSTDGSTPTDDCWLVEWLDSNCWLVISSIWLRFCVDRGRSNASDDDLSAILETSTSVVFTLPEDPNEHAFDEDGAVANYVRNPIPNNVPPMDMKSSIVDLGCMHEQPIACVGKPFTTWEIVGDELKDNVCQKPFNINVQNKTNPWGNNECCWHGRGVTLFPHVAWMWAPCLAQLSNVIIL